MERFFEAKYLEEVTFELKRLEVWKDLVGFKYFGTDQGYELSGKIKNVEKKDGKTLC